MAAEEVVAEDGVTPLVVADLEDALSRRASSYDGRVTCWKKKLPYKLALTPTFWLRAGPATYDVHTMM